MTDPVRLAGRASLEDGGVVTWTLAEGRKGRRWREVVADGESVRWSLLYETDPSGRFAHLELATAAGLATLHPEGDGTLHGNVVEPGAGVRHVVGLPFTHDTALLVAGSLAAAAAVTRWHAAGDEVVVLDPATLDLARRALREEDLCMIDPGGAPVGVDIVAWPLEA